MKQLALTSLLVVSLAAATGGTAAAQDSGDRPTALGVGVTGLLVSGPGFANQFAGPTVVFQTPAFHVEGLVTFSDTDDLGTDLGVGGRFWYALSQTPSSDFSIGGGLGLLVDDVPGGDDEVDVEIDLGAQIRAFVVPNVAFSATLGFGIVATDGDDFVGLIGDIMGAMGVVYFF